LPSQPPPSYGAPTRKPLPQLPLEDDNDDYSPTPSGPNTSTPAGKDCDQVTSPLTVSKQVFATEEQPVPGADSKRPPLVPRAESYVTLTSTIPLFESKSTAVGLPPLPSPMSPRQPRLMTPSRAVNSGSVTCPSTSKSKFVPIHNTRAIGRKLHIQLVKGKTS